MLGFSPLASNPLADDGGDVNVVVDVTVSVTGVSATALVLLRQKSRRLFLLLESPPRAALVM